MTVTNTLKDSVHIYEVCPEICEDYGPGYCAFFFEDPDGNKLEIYCRESPIIAK
jgi:catechol 2,3-dioxygenase-like lactoylglutathione lyase family enzyme